ncbi:MAG: ATP-binding protein [Desulfobacterales bacterium]|jgi:signal transduction histidine kinase
MWQRIGLRGRVYALLGFLVAATAVSGAATFWYAHEMETLLGEVVHKELEAFQTAETLVVALAQQKGFVSYYFIDGDPQWLRDLGIHRSIFDARLAQARRNAASGDEMAALDAIEEEYRRYTLGKDQVIQYYEAGQRQAGAKLHTQIRSRYFRTLELCEKFKRIHTRRLEKAQSESNAQLMRFRASAVLIFVFNLLLAFSLAVVLLRELFGPLRRLAVEAGLGEPATDHKDDLKSLSRSVRGLIKDIDDTHSALEKSREHLLQAEKMAVVGKLAAGMAHSIRNPFTSVKMRLFSLSRSLRLTEAQQEDFEVVAEEIRHIDTIVQNFLEFSRPPKLQMRKVSPSSVVDTTLQLLAHRLKAYDVTVTVQRERPLPEIEGDPEQIKEVLVNLIINACEAMEGGGRITIRESAATKGQGQGAAMVSVEDDGPGMSPSVQEKIFQPFYTTKEEGTGLGLSIAARIMEEHGGRLSVESTPGIGTAFVLLFPLEKAP